MEQQKKERIFISYKRVDKVRVFAIKDGIEKATGEKCWIDLDGIESDAQFADVIISAINRCEVFLFMYSASHTKIENHNHDWTISEINFAKKKDKRIVFVNIDNSPLTDWFELRFGTYQQLDATDSERLKRLNKDICSWLRIDTSKIQQDSSKAEQERLRKEKELQERMAQAEAAQKALEEKARLAEEKARKAEERANQIEKSHLVGKQVSKEEQRQTTTLSWEDAKENARRIEKIRASGANATSVQRYNVGRKPSIKDILETIGYCGLSIVAIAFALVIMLWCINPAIIYQDPNKLYEKGYKKEQINTSEGDLEIFQYYRRAAKKGHPAAMNRVALHYIEGMNGVRQNSQKAINWFNKAIENGNAEAAFNLGYLYETGKDVKQDQTKAIKYYTIAAERELAVAQHRLGNYYFMGTKVEKDQVVAVSWYKRAAANGYAAAQAMLGKCYQYGYGVSKDISQAISWYTKAADQGHAEAQSDLGQCYALGSGVKRDYAKAVEWFTKAAEQGYKNAQYSMGWAYEHGQGVDKNLAEAKKWYQKAADQGHADAKKRLSNL